MNAVAQQLASARQGVSDAEKDLAGGNSEKALQKANALRKQIEDQVNRISAAIQGANQHPQKR
jgi:archaellum component FlaC